MIRGINLKAIAEKMPNASGAECKVGEALQQPGTTSGLWLSWFWPPG